MLVSIPALVFIPKLLGLLQHSLTLPPIVGKFATQLYISSNKREVVFMLFLMLIQEIDVQDASGSFRIGRVQRREKR